MKIFVIYPEKDTMSIDSSQAFLKLGHQVFEYVLKIDHKTQSFAYDLVDIFKKIIEFKPDFVFSLNVSCLDHLGIAARSFYLLNIPVFIWFIDNPFYYFNKFSFLSVLPNVMVAVWDTFYLEEMKAYFSQIYHLPQCTNPERFQEIVLNDQDIAKFSADLSFAANLDSKKMEAFCAEVTTLFPYLSQEKITVLVLQGIEYALQNRSLSTSSVLAGVLKNNSFEIKQEYCRRLLERMIEFGVSAYERKRFVSDLTPYGLKVWGDGEWKKYISDEVFCGWSDYFTETVKLFRASKINLNLSRMQQRYSTNQRVFDVPAAKAFLISDFKREMEDYFEIDKEMICFSDLEDLKHKIAFYLDKPKQREKIIELGYEKVVSEHTYLKRMEQVIAWVKGKNFFTADKFSLKPEEASAYFNLGQVFEALKDLPQAVQYYRKTVLADRRYAKKVEGIMAALS